MQEFKNFMLNEHGVELPEYLVNDNGKMERFSVEGDKSGETSGYYIFHGHYGYAGDWRIHGENGINWFANSVTPEQRTVIIEENKQAGQQLALETASKQEELALKYEAYYLSLPIVKEHPYLTRKKIHHFDERLEGDTLIISIGDIHGKIWGFQRIYSDGQKRFSPGLKKKGNIFAYGKNPLQSNVILVCEGFATGATLATMFPEYAVIGALDSGNMPRVTSKLREYAPDATIIIIADNGDAGVKAANKAALNDNCKVVIPLVGVEVSDLKHDDANDLYCFYPNHINDFKRDVRCEAAPPPSIKSMFIQDFIVQELPPSVNLFGNFLFERSANMLFAPRGCGKSFVTMEIALAIATGTDFLGFTAPHKKRVLFIDGENNDAELLERFKGMVERKNLPENEAIMFKLASLDMQEGRELNLIDEMIARGMKADYEWADVIVWDNLSCLAPGTDGNESKNWEPLKKILLQLKALNKCVLFVHHTNKSGEQRGFGGKEDLLHTVIELSKPPEHEEIRTLIADLGFNKLRNGHLFKGSSLRISLLDDVWHYESLADAIEKEICAEYSSGEGLKDIQAIFNISYRKAASIIKKHGIMRLNQRPKSNSPKND